MSSFWLLLIFSEDKEQIKCLKDVFQPRVPKNMTLSYNPHYTYSPLFRGLPLNFELNVIKC